MIEGWMAAGSLDDESKPIRATQSAVAIRITSAIRYWLTLGQLGKGAKALATLDPLRRDADVEARQARVIALAERLRRLVRPTRHARGLEAPDR